MIKGKNFVGRLRIKKIRGFTLIELLVVLAIVAVLALVSILVLNPTELLRQARDSRRISDMSTLKTAVSLYISDVTSPSLGTNMRCYGSMGPTSSAACAVANGGPFRAGDIGSYGSSTINNKSVTGDGWLPIAFNSMSAGAPFGSLPVDPVNDANNFYMYLATSSPGITFKITAQMESAKYSSSGPNDVESTDGGLTTKWFESGTDLNL